jgi:hypothetical protein
MPFPGNVVPLSFQAHDRSEVLYVQAEVVDNTGAVIAGSPFTLAHVGNGKYTNDTLIMPSNVKYLEITYHPYTDAGFTTFSDDHATGTAVAVKEVTVDGTLTIVQVERIEGILKKQNKMTVNIDQPKLVKTLSTPVVKAKVDVPVIQGIMKRQKKIIGVFRECM